MKYISIFVLGLMITLSGWAEGNGDADPALAFDTGNGDRAEGRPGLEVQFAGADASPCPCNLSPARLGDTTTSVATTEVGTPNNLRPKHKLKGVAK